MLRSKTAATCRKHVVDNGESQQKSLDGAQPSGSTTVIVVFVYVPGRFKRLMRRSKSNLNHSDRVSEVISSPPRYSICRKECGLLAVGEETNTFENISHLPGRAPNLRDEPSRCQLCTAVDRGNLRNYCVDVVGLSLDLSSLLENQLPVAPTH